MVGSAAPRQFPDRRRGRIRRAPQPAPLVPPVVDVLWKPLVGPEAIGDLDPAASARLTNILLIQLLDGSDDLCFGFGDLARDRGGTAANRSAGCGSHTGQIARNVLKQTA